MADSISLKVLVDKKMNRVIYAESDEDFVDIIFSFLTTLIGTIVRLTSNQSPTLRMGSLNNLYTSVENMDAKYFRFQGRKAMLLSPRNWAESLCKKLKLNIDGDAAATKHFLCRTLNCSHRLLCHYEDAICNCGSLMKRKINLSEKESKDHGGVFVKERTRFIISDDLQVMPVSTMACFSLFSKYGITDGSAIEERTFTIAGTDEVLNLLGRSLVSRMPLTEALLKHKPLAELNNVNIFYRVISQTNEDMTNQEGKITVKLLVSKSKNMVCYAEAKKDFVNLLVSFLSVPLGYVVQNMHRGSSNGCIDQLYKSVQDLDEECFNSSERREMLVSPKLAFGFGYKNDLVGVEEGSQPSLVITSISSVFALSILNQMKIPFNDIEEKVVHVGKEEALRLLVSLFGSNSALTNAFIRGPKREQSKKMVGPLRGSKDRLWTLMKNGFNSNDHKEMLVFIVLIALIMSTSMADKHRNGLRLKAVVDREKSKVIFIEADSDFVDVLLSFLTIPIGTAITLAQKHLVSTGMGCVINVHTSVKNMDL
ncbi:hypothetical protein TIFTF001_000316 [Ficus carica]|uniref:Uncharacterized protein n=1 Tax=Ficus carica TaxID=3494 RepID=A0AA87YV86_FICCA|nr:hypothetical protein TIFTF001_000316 [Ficus carica]